MEVIDIGLQDGTYEHPYLVGAQDVPSLSERNECINGSWITCNSDMLMTLMSMGYVLTTPDVSGIDLSEYEGYSDKDLERLASAVGDLNDIESIEYVGDMEVQCIEVADSDHMYLTDEFFATHNTSNIVFLKSTDDSMLDTLEKMSGKTHRTYAESKMITQDVGKVVLQNEDKRSITYTTKEEPVISYNQMAFLGERQSIVFRASDPPVLNKNQMILPMSWRLFLNKIKHPGHDYSLQTIPTLSSAAEFDARKNLPRFEEMVNKRVSQAVYAQEAADAYKQAFDLDDYQVEQLDPDTYSDAVMEIIATKLAILHEKDADAYLEKVDLAKTVGPSAARTSENTEGKRQMQESARLAEELSKRIYAGGVIARTDIAQYDDGGKIISINHGLDEVFVEIFKDFKDRFKNDRQHFAIVGDSLMDTTRRLVYIECSHTEEADMRVLEHASKRVDSRVFDESAESGKVAREGNYGSYKVSDKFYHFLLAQSSWKNVAGGVIEREVSRRLSEN